MLSLLSNPRRPVVPSLTQHPIPSWRSCPPPSPFFIRVLFYSILSRLPSKNVLLPATRHREQKKASRTLHRNAKQLLYTPPTFHRPSSSLYLNVPPSKRTLAHSARQQKSQSHQHTRTSNTTHAIWGPAWKRHIFYLHRQSAGEQTALYFRLSCAPTCAPQLRVLCDSAFETNTAFFGVRVLRRVRQRAAL